VAIGPSIQEINNKQTKRSIKRQRGKRKQ